MIRKHTRRAAKAAFAISLGVAIVLGVFAGTARSATQAAPTIVIGTKNFPEEFILGELYTQALQAKGFNVTYKENIGSTEIIQTALTSGKINFYPEYTGVIVQDVFHHAISPKTAAATLRAREAARGREGLHAAQRDAVLRHRRARGHERDRQEVRAEDDLRPEEGRAVQARRIPGVPDAQHLLRRLHQAVRAHERDVRRRSGASRPTRRSTRARCSRRTSSRPIRRSSTPSKYTVLDRSQARHRASRTWLRSSRPRSSNAAGPTLRDDGQRGLVEAHACRRSSR